MTYQKGFECLADPTRRAILEILRSSESTVGKVADQLPVSRPAVSQHLKVLGDARLVSCRKAGTRHYYRIDPRGLQELREYLDRFWTGILAAYSETAKEESDDHGDSTDR